MTAQPTPLEAARLRIDEIDAQLLRLIDERASMPAKVVAAKALEADGGSVGFALRPAREAQVMRRLLAMERPSASADLIVRVWRELISDSLRQQGSFALAAWGGRRPERVVELTRARFGFGPPMQQFERPEEALQAARREGVVAVLGLDVGAAWWGRLLAEPTLRAFEVLPSFNAWGAPAAIAVAAVDLAPSGADQTLWVTDALEPDEQIQAALSSLGMAGDRLADGRGLRLFSIAGYVQADDARLASAPGRLKGGDRRRPASAGSITVGPDELSSL